MTDYCAGDVNHRVPEIIARIVKGNADAGRFLWQFWNFAQLIDDLVDRDRRVTVAQAAKEVIGFTHEISFNAFYQTHKASLFPLLATACDRWVMGDAMPTGTDEERGMARVVRCGELEVFCAVAYLLGGWEHMRAMSADIRRYDKG